MCVGLRTLFNDDFLDFLLSGRLRRVNVALLHLYFRHVRICEVVLHPDVDELITSAVEVCDCRLLAKRCESRLDLCFQLRKKELRDRPRSPGLLQMSEKAAMEGLVRLRVDTLGRVLEHCHCCSCCCQVLRIANYLGPSILTPSGHVPETSLRCVRCGKCEESCPMGARRDGRVDRDRCIGCGVCRRVCPRGAIELRPSEPSRAAPESFRRRSPHPVCANVLAFAGLLYMGWLHRVYLRSWRRGV